jgi:hypothetical protein
LVLIKGFQVSNKQSGEKTEFGPGKTPLYYNNVGLFSDPFLEDRLPNLEKFYNHPSTSFLNDYWNIEESDDAGKFNEAFQKIINLWDKLDKNIPKYCTKERQLQNTWIDKIFEHLGWTIELEETSSKNGITNYPDYALFSSVDDWKRSKDLTGNNKFKRATAVADAKDWGVSLDGKGFSNKNPSFQIINYLKQTDKNWGVLTDGKFWRIYSLRSDSKHSTFYEIDLEKILATGDVQRFKYFFNFFRVEAFVNDARLGDRTFLDFVFDDGQFYSTRVEKNLNERVYRVVDSVCKGFLVNYKEPTDADLKVVYEYSMYYLFKLMFVLNCESKGLLEVNKQDDYYEFSLRKKSLELKEQLEQGKKWSLQPKTYNYILDLFELLKKGDSNIGVHGFGSGPFEIGSNEFYANNKITDEDLNAALIDLSCDYDEDKNLQFIDYKILSPDHIGSLFEGLLEFSLKKKGRTIDLVSSKGDRKSTGSYYTPDYLVDYIVEETLMPLTENKNPSELLSLRVLDPAMGSGHFLLGVVKFLEKRIIEIQDTDKKISGAITFDQIKKEVLKNCVFGVDINSLATQLAKFSLWIYTSKKGDNVATLSKQLISNNTLADSLDWHIEFKGKLISGKIDAIVGNPPYIGEKGNRPIFEEIEKSGFGKRFYQSKMDYFYFFFHKGLDLLKDGAPLSFITTNYYLNASRADLLRKDFKARSTILKLINFNERKIFKSAQGQHNMVTFLKKGKSQAACSVIEVTGKGQLSEEEFSQMINSTTIKLKKIKQSDLYQGDECKINVDISSAGSIGSILTKISSQAKKLDHFVNVEKGLHTGADKVSQSHIDKYKVPHKKGEGIFFLTEKEVKDLKLTQKEKNRLVPLFKNSDIGKFKTAEKAELWMIDFAYPRDKALKVESEYPALYAHLLKYKKILTSRKDTANGLQKAIGAGIWWTIAARKKMDFEGPKIVAPQRSHNNTFGYNEIPWYGSGDIYFISNYEDKSYDLKFLTGILNSKLMYFWLYYCGKRKGEALELYQDPISEIMLKNYDNKFIDQISSLTSAILNSDSNGFIEKKFADLNARIYSFYNLTEAEIEQVESHYDKRFGKSVVEKVS